MITKKKILVTASIGTAAIVAGVAPTIASVTSTQSSVVNATTDPADPNNPNQPDNPGEQVDPNQPDNPGDQNDPNQPDTPDTPVDPPAPTYATAPDEDIFTLQIALSSLNNTNLNNYLTNISETNIINDYYYFHKNFENSDQYSHVYVSYVPNSIDYSKKTFEISVIPTEKATWENTNDKTQKIIKVRMDKNASIPDATVPIKPRNNAFYLTIYDSTIKTNSTNEDLNKWFINYFKNYKLSDFSAINSSDYSYKNVELSYVENSADIKQKTFKMKATPKANHSWVNSAFYNDTITDSFTLDVSITDLTFYDKSVTLPSSWAINWVVNSEFKFTYLNVNNFDWYCLGWFLDPDFDYYWWSVNPKFYHELRAFYQKVLYEEGWRDIAKYYPVELAGDFDSVKWGYVQRINGGILLNYSVPVKPIDGNVWSDGKKDARYIQLRLFVSSKPDVGASGLIGNTFYVSNLKKYNDEEKTDDLPSNYWVTNGLMVVGNNLTKPTLEENKKVIADIVKGDLENCFPKYNIEISNVRTRAPGGNWHWTWQYTIKFVSKTNPSFTKTIDGFLFTIG